MLFDFLIDENGAISTIYAHHTENDMNLALVQPWCSIGSDGSALAIDGPLRRGHPHPRNFGTFPRILGEYVRNRQLLRLEDAVRKMTSLNAAKVGLLDRGLLRPGQFADVVIFDPATVIDHSTYLEPFQYSTGIIHVLVNGKLVLEKGQPVKSRPGRALRHGRSSSTREICSRSREIKNRPENRSQTTTSPLVVQNPIDWPVGRENSSVTTHASEPLA